METVNHPKHYNQGKFEVIEVIEDQQLGFHLGNALKYICRAGKKDPTKVVEDLRKAKWYLERQIELYENHPRRPNDMNERETNKPEIPRDVLDLREAWDKLCDAFYVTWKEFCPLTPPPPKFFNRFMERSGVTGKVFAKDEEKH